MAGADAPCGNVQRIFIEICPVGLSGMPRWLYEPMASLKVSFQILHLLSQVQLFLSLIILSPTSLRRRELPQDMLNKNHMTADYVICLPLFIMKTCNTTPLNKFDCV